MKSKFCGHSLALLFPTLFKIGVLKRASMIAKNNKNDKSIKELSVCHIKLDISQ